MPVLTDAAVRKYVARPKRREIPDSRAQGLYLVVQPSGQKSWALRFRRPSGKPAKFTLGQVDFAAEPTDEPVIGAPLTLAMARQLAATIERDRKKGLDVIAERKAETERRTARVEERHTFGAAVVEFCTSYRTGRHTPLRRQRDTARVLGLAVVEGGGLEVLPGGLAERWCDKPVAEIDGHDIHTLIDEARKIGVPGVTPHNKGVSEPRGRALYAALSTFFRWLVRERRIAANPCAGVWRPGPPPPRDRVLGDSEIRWFWKACEKLGPPAEGILKLLLVTGARRDEVLRMTHGELSEDGLTWSLAKERTKNWRPHSVPLSPLACSIIAATPKVEGERGFVFTVSGKRPYSAFGKFKRRLDELMLEFAREQAGAKAVIPAWTLHDLRRSCATGMAELGIAPHVIEAVLNHISGARAGVAGIYNRSELLPERRAGLERWASHIEGLVSGKPANVVPLPKGRRK